MGALTDYGEVLALKFITGQSVTQPSAPLYLALFTDAGTDSSAGTEVTGGSYARQTIAFGTPTSGAGTVINSADITFANMPACTITHAAVYDAATSGNRLFYGVLTTSQIINAGGSAVALAGSLTFAID